MRFAFLLVFGLVSATSAAEPWLRITDVYVAKELNAKMVHIPALVVTAKGTLLTFCESRKDPGGDWGLTQIIMRRSTDGGNTFSPGVNVARIAGPIEENPAAKAQGMGKPGRTTYGNPLAIVDRKTGTIHFLFCVNYNRCFYRRSSDDGLTFSEPVEITTTFETYRPEYPWQVLAVGPGHGIQLTNGRLLATAWLSEGTGGSAHRPSVITTIYSDDDGRTWQRGEIIGTETDPLLNPSESQAVELADGRVMLNIRHESAECSRAVAFSSGGSSGWTLPTFDKQLPEPVCMASMVRLTFASSDGKNRLLFSNPNNGVEGDFQSKRKNLTVRLSEDEGKTWPIARSLDSGPSGYSDLAATPDGTTYCLYGCGDLHAYEKIKLAAFNLEWLTDRAGQ